MAGQLVMGPFPLDTQLSGLAWWGWGLPASSREVTQPQPWQLVNPGSYEGGQRVRPRLRPEPSTPTRPRRPRRVRRVRARRCIASPPPARAPPLICSLSELLNGSLCAPQELAGQSPDRNAGPRYLLWVQAPLGALPILWEAGLYFAAGLFSYLGASWELGEWENVLHPCTVGSWPGTW